MGNLCCVVRNAPTMTVEDKLKFSEDLYNLKHHPALEIDRLAHRYCTNLKISGMQFSALCRDLKLDENSQGYAFLNSFFNAEENYYNSRLFTCVGILYGSGTPQEKIVILFENYDSDNSKNLNAEELKVMIDDLTSIAFMYSTSFIIKSETDDLELREYRTELLKFRRTMAHYFTNLILENNPDGINFDEFVKSFEKDDLLCLLDPHEMRLATKKVKKVIEKAEKLIHAAMENPKSIDKNVINRLNSVKNRKRNSKIKNP